MDEIFLRRSVRKYKDIKIEKEKIDLLLKAAFQAPSARAQKSRSFVVVDDKKTILELSNISAGAKILKDAPLVIAVYYDGDMSLPTIDMIPQDLAASTQNILLCATSLNIGSCWIGVYPKEDRMNKAMEILNIKEGYVFSLIALGYPLDDDAFYEKDKFEADKIHYNKVK